MSTRILPALGALLLTGPVIAQDFSCMSMEVKSKAQVSAQHIEYDVVFSNNCPGAVYWTACVETLDPWSLEISTPLEPGGLVEDGERAKVNLQMKRTPSPDGARTAFQWFYVTPAYSLEPRISAECRARSCESQKSDLRREWTRNDQAWQQALAAMDREAVDRCPKTAWDNTEQETCMEQVRAGHSDEMKGFANRQKEIERQLEEVDPENCVTHGGH